VHPFVVCCNQDTPRNGQPAKATTSATWVLEYVAGAVGRPAIESEQTLPIVQVVGKGTAQLSTYVNTSCIDKSGPIPRDVGWLAECGREASAMASGDFDRLLDSLLSSVRDLAASLYLLHPIHSASGTVLSRVQKVNCWIDIDSASAIFIQLIGMPSQLLPLHSSAYRACTRSWMADVPM